jgi:hypothetical protein
MRPRRPFYCMLVLKGNRDASELSVLKIVNTTGKLYVSTPGLAGMRPPPPWNTITSRCY